MTSAGRVRGMPTGPDFRVAALDDLLDEAGLDAVLATKDASIAYLTGFWGLQLERFFGVAVRRGGAGALVARSLDREGVGRAPTGLDRILYPTGESNGLPEVGRVLDGARRIGVEEDHLTFARIQEVSEEFWAALRPGQTEAEVNARAQYSLSRRGGKHAEPHILFGAHSADPHGSPGERVLEPGDVVVADIAAQFDGYWGDLTRCAVVGE